MVFNLTPFLRRRDSFELARSFSGSRRDTQSGPFSPREKVRRGQANLA